MLLLGEPPRSYAPPRRAASCPTPPHQPLPGDMPSRLPPPTTSRQCRRAAMLPVPGVLDSVATLPHWSRGRLPACRDAEEGPGRPEAWSGAGQSHLAATNSGQPRISGSSSTRRRSVAGRRRSRRRAREQADGTRGNRPAARGEQASSAEGGHRASPSDPDRSPTPSPHSPAPPPPRTRCSRRPPSPARGSTTARRRYGQLARPSYGRDLARREAPSPDPAGQSAVEPGCPEARRGTAGPGRVPCLPCTQSPLRWSAATTRASSSTCFCPISSLLCVVAAAPFEYAVSTVSFFL